MTAVPSPRRTRRRTTPPDFTRAERTYLLSLPAVTAVHGQRICYSNEFRDDCIRRYEEGASPVKLFRESRPRPQTHRIQTHRALHRPLARRRNQSRDSSRQSRRTAVRKQSSGGQSSGRQPSRGQPGR